MITSSKLACIAACAALAGALATPGASAADATHSHKARRPAARAAAPAPVEAPLPPASEDQLRAAEQVEYGELACEFKQKVDVKMDSLAPGYVAVAFGRQAWRMKPVLSSTGAVRLEDSKGAALLVQIADKSMILNTKTGQRLVDDCQSAQQARYREMSRSAPPQPGLGVSNANSN